MTYAQSFASSVKESLKQLLEWAAYYFTSREIWYLPPENTMNRNSHQRCSVRKGILRNLANFTGKQQCQSLFFNKFASLRPATSLKKRLWHRFFPVNFSRILRTPFLQNTSGRRLLNEARRVKLSQTKKFIDIIPGQKMRNAKVVIIKWCCCPTKKRKVGNYNSKGRNFARKCILRRAQTN